MPELTPNQRECAGLTSTLIEGVLGEEQRDRLNELCREDPACRKLYLAEMSVHSMLLWTSDLSMNRNEEMDEPDTFLMEVYEEARLNRIKLDAEAELARNLRAQADQEKRRRLVLDSTAQKNLSRSIIIPRLAVFGGAAAAVLLAVVLLWPMLQSPNSSTTLTDAQDLADAAPQVSLTATLVRSVDAVWDQTIPDDRVLKGEDAWSLDQGFAEIVMPSGASVILHGPTTFRLVDENALILDQGRLTAEVPDRAKYFTVKTRSMDVIDLGTRFGVNVDTDGSTSASVFEGKVEVHEPISQSSASSRKIELAAGQRVSSDPAGKLDASVSEIEMDHGYVPRWDAIKRLVSVQGQARFFNLPPQSVRHGDLLETNRLIIFEESAVVLHQPLQVMSNLSERRAADFVTIPSGRRVVSYFIHSAPTFEDKNSYATATLTFPGRVLGLVGNTAGLRGTNGLFGLEEVDYVPDSDRSTYGIDPGSPDHFAIGGLQGNILTIHLAAGAFADQVRVIVELPEAEDE